MKNVVLVDVNFFDSPAIQRASVRLGCDVAAMPIRLWAYCAKYFPTQGGLLPDLSRSLIEDIAGWKGEGGRMVQAFLDLGLLLECGRGFVIPDWHKLHDGRFHKRRRKLPEDVRAAILSAGVCERCGATDNLTVDHRIPLSRGGKDDPSNLACLCGSCNSSKSDKCPG